MVDVQRVDQLCTIRGMTSLLPGVGAHLAAREMSPSLFSFTAVRSCHSCWAKATATDMCSSLYIGSAMHSLVSRRCTCCITQSCSDPWPENGNLGQSKQHRRLWYVEWHMKFATQHNTWCTTQQSQAQVQQSSIYLQCTWRLHYALPAVFWHVSVPCSTYWLWHPWPGLALHAAFWLLLFVPQFWGNWNAFCMSLLLSLSVQGACLWLQQVQGTHFPVNTMHSDA